MHDISMNCQKDLWYLYSNISCLTDTAAAIVKALSSCNLCICLFASHLPLSVQAMVTIGDTDRLQHLAIFANLHWRPFFSGAGDWVTLHTLLSTETNGEPEWRKKWAIKARTSFAQFPSATCFEYGWGAVSE